VLLAAQGCCPNAGSSTTAGSDRSDCSPVPAPKPDHSPAKNQDKSTTRKGSHASRFGGPYPCQDVRETLNRFAAYEVAGLDHVKVCELTCDLFRKSIEANLKRADKLGLPDSVRRFQRYNFVIDHQGRLLVAVWTDDEKLLKNVEKRHGIKWLADDRSGVKGAMVDFGLENQFAPTDEKLPTGTTAYIDVPGSASADQVGILGASSEHFRIVQEGNGQFDPATWMSRTVAYAGELIVDTAAKNSAGDPAHYFYLNNASPAYLPDGHYLRTVAHYVRKELTIAPRYLQDPHSEKVWTFHVGPDSVLSPPKTGQ